MHVIEARNVHQALPLALGYLYKYGIQRESRNGPVYQSPVPVTTVYKRPWERVLFWEERDANPFFHLYESLWMLDGRNDLAPLVKFAKNMATFSDDGKTVNGAYGYRWRYAFSPEDQLATIAGILRKNKDDRRCVLQMWDASSDLGSSSKDVPCNTMATLQVNTEGQLDLSVFNRSNDIVWGAYGANAVHFSFLQEYMAAWIGVPVGKYYQVSINWHGYLNTLKQVESLSTLQPNSIRTPYDDPTGPVPMRLPTRDGVENDLDITDVLAAVDNDFESGYGSPYWRRFGTQFFRTAYWIFYAHHLYKCEPPAHRFNAAYDALGECDQRLDWVVACREWLDRREKKANERNSK